MPYPDAYGMTRGRIRPNIAKASDAYGMTEGEGRLVIFAPPCNHLPPKPHSWAKAKQPQETIADLLRNCFKTTINWFSMPHTSEIRNHTSEIYL